LAKPLVTMTQQTIVHVQAILGSMTDIRNDVNLTNIFVKLVDANGFLFSDMLN
jgi:hypothetical protein